MPSDVAVVAFIWASGRDVVCSQSFLYIALHIYIRASTKKDKISIPRQSLTYMTDLLTVPMSIQHKD